jgi:hypothetical protein
VTNAVAARDPAAGMVFHADRGCRPAASTPGLLRI